MADLDKSKISTQTAAIILVAAVSSAITLVWAFAGLSSKVDGAIMDNQRQDQENIPRDKKIDEIRDAVLIMKARSDIEVKRRSRGI